YPLQALDPDIAHGEIGIARRLCERQCAMRKQGNGGQDGASLHASLTITFFRARCALLFLGAVVCIQLNWRAMSLNSATPISRMSTAMQICCPNAWARSERGLPLSNSTS